MNDAITDAVGQGAIVVVAAGNEDSDASEFTPANAPDAITVASVGNTGGNRTTPKKASYSNFGDKVDIAAPGGEQAEDIDEDGQPDGVLSTIDDFVAFYQGTSMATPHVAGIAMLLKSVDPTLDQEQVRQILKDSSNPDVDCPEGCGDGVVSAAAALLAVGGGLDGAHVVGSPTTIRIGKDTLDTPVVWKNLGNAATSITIEEPGGANRDLCEVDSGGGNVGANGGTLAATVTIARTGDDRGECTITATYDGPDGAESAEVRVVWTPDTIAPLQKVLIGGLLIKDDKFTVERQVETSELQKFQYKLFNLTPGSYLVIGLVDGNNNDSFDDPEDGVGIFIPKGAGGGDEVCTTASCGRVKVKAGDHLKKADFIVTTGFDGDDGTGGTGDGELGAPCAASEDCGGGLYCDTALPGGYCTTDCFGDADCGTNGLCFPLIADDIEYQVCLRACTVDADCGRNDNGYICDGDGTCYPG
jgi:serine protease